MARVEIGNRDRLALRGSFAEHAVVGVDREMAALGGLVDADRFGEVECVVGGIIAVDQHRIGVGDFERAGGDRRQHGVEIERGRDRAADFLEHLQLIDRLREIPRAFLHLPFEVGIGLRNCPAMLFNCLASSSSSSAVLTSIRWPKSPAPSRRAPVWKAVIGTSMRRA